MTSISIADFYAGRSILVTGATGFMGKVLVEKLLRSCPSLEAVYILVRPKRGQDVQQRLGDIIKSKLFEKLKEEQPNFAEKIIAISGDIVMPDLGISQSDMQLITSKVSIVFHSAATVKFDEALKLSVKMNVYGVKKLLEICHKMEKLEAFIHVSTAYANCDKVYIQESVYPPPLHPSKLLDAIEWMDNDTIDILTPKLIAGRPNTYTYTKALAEYLLVEEGHDLPIAVIRPSIVGSSLQEPFEGWVDNFNGPSGLMASISSGLLRTMVGNRKLTADIVPVDLSVNMMIAAAWYTAIQRPSSINIYHCTTGQLNRITWGEIEKAAYKFAYKHPMGNVVRLPNPRFTKYRVIHFLRTWLDHNLPSFLLDMYMRLLGKKPMFLRLTDRIHRSVGSLEYFTSHGWTFCNDNLNMLLEKLTPEDREIFNFDMKKIDWEKYLENYSLGIKRFALKEDASKESQARQRMARLQKLSMFTNAVVIVGIWRLLINRVAIARQLWDFLLSFVFRILKKIPTFNK